MGGCGRAQYVGAWPELITDVNEDMDISAIRIQARVSTAAPAHKRQMLDDPEGTGSKS